MRAASSTRSFCWHRARRRDGSTSRARTFPRCYSLRTLEDSDRIRNALRTAERAVVVGGGFIGMEVAASLRRLGLEVTLIHLGTGLYDQFGSVELSDDLASLYREHGVELMLAEEVATFAGDGRLEYVETRSGACVEADIAVVGVGVVPNVGFLARSRVALANGILVNQRFETGAPGVYAAGDAANFYDPLYRRRRRIEHWSNANYQGTEVGKILAGREAGTTLSRRSSPKSSARPSRSSATSPGSTH